MSTSELFQYVQAGKALIWMETFEESRTLVTSLKELNKLIKAGAFVDPETEKLFKFKTTTWDCADGIKEIGLKEGRMTTEQPIKKQVDDGGEVMELPTTDPLDALNWLETQPTKLEDGTLMGHIMFLKDFHVFFDKDHYAQTPQVIRKIRNILTKLAATSKTLVILSPLVNIPDEIEKEIRKITFALPNRDGLRSILKSMCISNGVDYPTANEDAIIDAGLGLTSNEFEECVAVSIVETDGEVAPQVIMSEKAKTVELTGLLEVFRATESLDSVGGNENLKIWVQKSMLLVGEEARAFGARPPKGVLLVGVPGCGKSLAAQAIANVSNRPLLRFDVGKVFDKYQGESEAKIRRCLAIAEAVAPCVLWIDEMEKSFSGTGAGDSDGHGTTKRVFSTFLTWLQERNADVFMVATANNVVSLPPELYRPGRIDASFWLGLPENDNREEILRIHLKKKERKDNLFSKADYKELVSASVGFSGAAIQVWVQAAVNHAFISEHDEVTKQDFLDTVEEISITDMTEKNIVSAQKWAKKNKARMASSSAKLRIKEPEVEGERKVALNLNGKRPSVKIPGEGAGEAGENASEES